MIDMILRHQINEYFITQERDTSVMKLLYPLRNKREMRPLLKGKLRTPRKHSLCPGCFVEDPPPRRIRNGNALSGELLQG